MAQVVGIMEDNGLPNLHGQYHGRDLVAPKVKTPVAPFTNMV